MTQRGLLRSAQIVMAIVASSSALVALSFLATLRWSMFGMIAVGVFGSGFTIGMAAFWLTHWPTRIQSQIAIISGTLFIAVWSVAQPTAAVALLTCTATAVTGGYMAFFHSAKFLLFNFVVGVAIANAATWRLATETNIVTAVGAFWLIWFVILCVPLSILGISRAMGTFAVRSGADPLTGLLNRRGFTDAIASQLAQEHPPSRVLAVVMVDLDDFKLINDTHGHAAGDRALLSVAELLRQHSPPDAAICRAGGEEFLIAAITEPNAAERASSCLCTAIAALSHRVTASIGTSWIPLDKLRCPDPGSSIDDLIAAADNAMYIAKRNGGNRAQQAQR